MAHTGSVDELAKQNEEKVKKQVMYKRFIYASVGPGIHRFPGALPHPPSGDEVISRRFQGDFQAVFDGKLGPQSSNLVVVEATHWHK